MVQTVFFHSRADAKEFWWKKTLIQNKHQNFYRLWSQNHKLLPVKMFHQWVEKVTSYWSKLVHHWFRFWFGSSLSKPPGFAFYTFLDNVFPILWWIFITGYLLNLTTRYCGWFWLAFLLHWFWKLLSSCTYYLPTDNSWHQISWEKSHRYEKSKIPDQPVEHMF